MALSAVPYALVVDDDSLVRIDAVQILEEAGFRCFDVETGDKAQALLEKRGGRLPQPEISLRWKVAARPDQTERAIVYQCSPWRNEP